MKYIFFGTPSFAAEILTVLLAEKMPPIAVVCNPDRPVGAKRVITAPPVKQVIGMRDDVLLLQPEKPTEIIEKLQSLKPDVFVVAAYTHIIPKSVLAIPRLGTIGVHPSLLPNYRGSTPIQSVILAGEEMTGVSLYHMDEKMDHGPIITNSKLQITNDDTYQSLEKKLATLAGEMLIALIPVLEKAIALAKPQDHAKATFTKKFETNDAEVDMKNDAPELIWRKIRALNPEPGTFTLNFPGREGKRVKLLDAGWSDNRLAVKVIQPDGKKPFRL